MKTLQNKLLKGRLTRWGFLAVLLVALGATVGWENQSHHRQYKLGGAFIGTSPGLVWNAVHTPLDPDGRTAALVVRTVDDDGSLAALTTAFGGDTGTEGVGEMRMISRDTVKFTMVAYAQLAGLPLQTTAIFVYSGTGKFTGPDNITLNYTLNVYSALAGDPASADLDRDGFPDAGATPALTIPGVTGEAKRVPIL